MKTHQNAYLDETYKIIGQLLTDEADLQPMRSAIFALGHVGNQLAVPLIVGFAAHPDCEVRYAVASALGSFPNDPESVEALLALSQDADADVRNWATFGFGVLGDLDTPVIRDALFLRIHDPFEPARLEAFMGLAMRKDARIVPMLVEILGQQVVNSGYIHAADELLGVVAGDGDAWSDAEYIEKLKNFSVPAA
jgi:HEAT repeat protein